MAENNLPDKDDVSDDLYEYLREKQGIATPTFKNHYSVVSRFEAWLHNERDKDTPLEATPRDVRDWLLKQEDDGRAGSTVHQYKDTLKSFFSEWMNGNEDEVNMLPSPLDENPANFDLTRYLDAPRDPVKQQYADNNEGVIYLSPQDVQQLRRHVPKPRVRNELVIKILVQTGLRRGELSQIELEHLNRDQGTITVTADVSKTNTKRTVPYDDLSPELGLWLDGGRRDHLAPADDSPYLLLTKQSEQLSPSRISQIVRDAADDAGIAGSMGTNARGEERRRVTAHTLRATFIMRLLDEGIPTPKVMELSGHENLQTVESYANVLDDDAIEAYRGADIQWG